uniref:Uncharacterized protein n=1 Tax=Tanacetum cinerariifolium TaxID=118510 RepID=A0A6L2MEN2_TANCI|nr:hypothetical protein [Tanacetum cinerariifolium]
MILENLSLHEEIREVDHHEKLVFLVILENLKKCLENVLVLVLMEYLLMDHLGQLTLTQENRLKSTALGAAATRTRETTLDGGVRSHRMKLES